MSSRSAAAAALLVAVILSVGAWAWLGRPVALPDVPDGRFECLSYAASSDAGSPLDARDGVFPIPEGLVERDIATLAAYTGCVRTYSAMGRQGDAVAAAAEHGMEVLLGIWIGPDREQNAVEIDRALALAHARPDTVRMLVVGNEVLLRRELSEARLIETLEAVRRRTDLPVAYAEVLGFWERYPDVADAVDVALVHVLPYWKDVPPPVRVADAQAQVRQLVARARAALPDAEIMIGEIGWPSAGPTRARAVPSRANQARFVRELAVQAEALGVAYNVIEAIDQPWKRALEGTVGGHWGILDKDRAPKFPLTGPVSEWPDWHWAAAFTLAVSVLALAPAATARRRPGPAAWAALGLAGPALGITLWMLAAQVAAFAAGPLGWLYGTFLLALALVGGTLLVLQLAGRIPDTRPAGLRSAVRALARPREWTPAMAVGGLWAVTLAAAALTALLLALDGRYREFPPLAYWPMAAAFLPWSRRARAESPAGDRSEEAWLAALLLVCGFGAIDHPGNREAWAWATTCAVLALPWLGAIRAEAARLARALVAAREQQAREQGGGR